MAKNIFEVLNRVLARSFGGEDVADAPGMQSDDFWPTVPGAAGADEALESLSEHLTSRDTSAPIRWVFLEGGAGNGKSFLASKLVQDSNAKEVDEAANNVAARAYNYRVGQRKLRIVNDATIPTNFYAKSGEKTTDLYKDLIDSFAKKQDLLVCVNRGVIVEELAALGHQKDNSKIGAVARALLNWLAGEKFRIDGSDYEVEVSGADNYSGYLRACCVKRKGKQILVIHAVSMDYVSILEPRPKLDGVTGAVEWNEWKPKCATYELSSFKKPSANASPAGMAIGKLLERFSEVNEGDNYSPFYANLMSLNVPSYQAGLIKIVRSAAVVAGHRITFRDWWGIASLAFVGLRREEFQVEASGSNSIEDWFNSTRARCLGSSTEDRLAALIELAMQRSHMAIFSAKSPSLIAGRYTSLIRAKAAALDALRMVDPVLDPTIQGSGDVHEALQSVSLHEAPSKILKNNSEAFRLVWTEFDEILESSLLQFCVDQRKNQSRVGLLSWYGQYLTRLYGVANGLPAGNIVIGLWFENWSRAFRNQSITSPLESGLEILLFGEKISEYGNDVFLPALASRSRPVSGKDGLQLVLAVPRQSIHFGLRANGDSLMLELQDNSGSVLSSRPIDYQLCREAWACRGGRQGFTEQSDKSLPRLERLRASFLSNNHNSRPGAIKPMACVFVGSETKEIEL